MLLLLLIVTYMKNQRGFITGIDFLICDNYNVNFISINNYLYLLTVQYTHTHTHTHTHVQAKKLAISGVPILLGTLLAACFGAGSQILPGGDPLY